MQHITISELRTDLREIVESVAFQGHHMVVSRHGKDAVAVIPSDVYKEWAHHAEARRP